MGTSTALTPKHSSTSQASTSALSAPRGGSTGRLRFPSQKQARHCYAETLPLNSWYYGRRWKTIPQRSGTLSHWRHHCLPSAAQLLRANKDCQSSTARGTAHSSSKELPGSRFRSASRINAIDPTSSRTYVKLHRDPRMSKKSYCSRGFT